jgi:hypothetical protein
MSSKKDLSFWAALLVGFFGLLRKSTLIPKSKLAGDTQALLRKDVVNFEKDSFVLVVRYLKTIQFGQKVLQIPYCKCADFNLCPVSTLLLHLTSSKLRLDCPLFDYTESGVVRSWNHVTFVAKLRQCLLMCKIDPAQYSGHSLRRGGCSACFMAGLSVQDIKQRGDWKSACFEKYLHLPGERLFASARLLSSSVLLD